MRKHGRRRHDAHLRARGVCTEHSALFDATPGGRKTRAALGTQNNADKAVGILEAIVVNMPAGWPEVLTKLHMAKRVGPRVSAAVPAKPAPSPAPPSPPADKAA